MRDSQARMPLYVKVRNYLLEQIQRQQWRANDRLPTEAELAKLFDVSKFTVKKAMDELVKEEIIYRIQGKGSFVSQANDVDDNPKDDMAPLLPLQLVALIMPSVCGGLPANLMAGVEEQLTKLGYHVFYRSTNNDHEQERSILRECVQLGVKGVIIYPADGESYNEEILQLTLNKFPVVVIDRYLRGVDTNCVCADHVGGAYQATAHLIELGHKRIAYIGLMPQMTTSMEDRLVGYEKALAEHNIPIDYNLCLNEWVSEENKDKDSLVISTMIRQKIRTFLEQNTDITAVFAGTNDLGIAAIETGLELGRRIPEQLSVVFFDDYVHSSFSLIPPSCVVQPEKQIGVEAARMLVSIIDNPLQERRKLTLPTELVLRRSTAPLMK